MNNPIPKSLYALAAAGALATAACGPSDIEKREYTRMTRVVSDAMRSASTIDTTWLIQGPTRGDLNGYITRTRTLPSGASFSDHCSVSDLNFNNPNGRIDLSLSLVNHWSVTREDSVSKPFLSGASKASIDEKRQACTALIEDAYRALDAAGISEFSGSLQLRRKHIK